MKIRQITALLALSAAMHELHGDKEEFILGGLKFTKGESSFSGPEDQVLKKVTHMERNFETQHRIIEKPAYPTQPEEPPEDKSLSQAQVMTNERLAAALAKLDHADDTHWNHNGQPNLKAVCNFYGSTDVTRAAVEAAMPGLKRLPAQEEKAAEAPPQEQANPAAVAQAENKQADLGNEQSTGA